MVCLVLLSSCYFHCFILIDFIPSNSFALLFRHFPSLCSFRLHCVIIYYTFFALFSVLSFRFVVLVSSHFPCLISFYFLSLAVYPTPATSLTFLPSFSISDVILTFEFVFLFTLNSVLFYSAPLLQCLSSTIHLAIFCVFSPFLSDITTPAFIPCFFVCPSCRSSVKSCFISVSNSYFQCCFLPAVYPFLYHLCNFVFFQVVLFYLLEISLPLKHLPLCCT